MMKRAAISRTRTCWMKPPTLLLVGDDFLHFLPVFPEANTLSEARPINVRISIRFPLATHFFLAVVLAYFQPHVQADSAFGSPFSPWIQVSFRKYSSAGSAAI